MGFLFYVCIFIMLCSAVVGVFNYSKLVPALRWVLFAVVFALLTEAFGYWAQKHFGNNKLVFLIANPIETILYVLFFIEVIPQKTIKWISITASSYIFLASFVNIVFAAETLMSFFYFIIIKGIIITLLCLIYLYNLFALDETKNDINTDLLIIVTGLVFYYSFSSIFYSIWNYQTKRNVDISVILQIKPYLFIVYMVFQCALLFTFVKASVQKKMPGNVFKGY